MTGAPSHPPLRLADVVFPARDQTLARVAADLSEPETGPPADNLLSNEDSVFRVGDRVAQMAPREGVYLGVGPDQNLTLIAHAEPSLAFVIDFRRRNTLLHLVHKALISLAPHAGRLPDPPPRPRPRPLPPDPTADDLVAAFARARFDRARLAAEVRAVADSSAPSTSSAPTSGPPSPPSRPSSPAPG